MYRNNGLSVCKYQHTSVRRENIWRRHFYMLARLAKRRSTKKGDTRITNCVVVDKDALPSEFRSTGLPFEASVDTENQGWTSRDFLCAAS
jgi:hypothetical protein